MPENRETSPKRYSPPLPTEIDTPDPVIKAAVRGKEALIIAKAKEVIEASGVLQLPEGAEPPTSFIIGGVTTVQAFSKGVLGGQEVVLRTVVSLVPPDNYTKELGICDPFIVFDIYIEPLGSGRHIKLQNPILSTTLNSLTEKRGKGVESVYSLDDFKKDVFTKLNPQEIEEILQGYLESRPDKKSADNHYQKITGKGRTPGSGRIIKVY